MELDWQPSEQVVDRLTEDNLDVIQLKRVDSQYIPVSNR
jgi:hypothetical protein